MTPGRPSHVWLKPSKLIWSLKPQGRFVLPNTQSQSICPYNVIMCHHSGTKFPRENVWGLPPPHCMLGIVGQYVHEAWETAFAAKKHYTSFWQKTHLPFHEIVPGRNDCKQMAETSQQPARNISNPSANSLCSATNVCWQCGTARIRLPQLQQSIDISCLPGPQQQTCCAALVALLWAHSGTDRQNPYSFTAPAPAQR